MMLTYLAQELNPKGLDSELSAAPELIHPLFCLHAGMIYKEHV